MESMTQAQLDAVTYDMYVNVGRNAAAAARELGCSPSTVITRVRRHVLSVPLSDILIGRAAEQ